MLALLAAVVWACYSVLIKKISGYGKYPVTVKLHYVAYGKENIIRAFSEISHEEKKPVILCKYASSMLHLNSSKYFLTEFSGVHRPATSWFYTLYW